MSVVGDLTIRYGPDWTEADLTEAELESLYSERQATNPPNDTPDVGELLEAFNGLPDLKAQEAFLEGISDDGLKEAVSGAGTRRIEKPTEGVDLEALSFDDPNANDAVVRAFRANEVPISAELLTEFTRLAKEADQLPPGERRNGVIREAAGLIAYAKAEASATFGEVTERRTFTDRDGSLVTQEADSRGHRREVSRHSAEEVEAAMDAEAGASEPLDANAGIAELAAASPAEFAAFEAANPGRVDAILREAAS